MRIERIALLSDISRAVRWADHQAVKLSVARTCGRITRRNYGLLGRTHLAETW